MKISHIWRRVGKKCQIKETEFAWISWCKRGSGGCDQRVCCFRTGRHAFSCWQVRGSAVIYKSWKIDPMGGKGQGGNCFVSGTVAARVLGFKWVGKPSALKTDQLGDRGVNLPGSEGHQGLWISTMHLLGSALYVGFPWSVVRDCLHENFLGCLLKM